MTKLSAKLVSLTQPVIPLKNESPEGIIAYCARVSNPEFQDQDNMKLLDYCKRNKHWSIFEMADATLEIEAPRDITRQLLRHNSFKFQEFSQRYSDKIASTIRQFRRQHETDRQSSIDDLSSDEYNRAEVHSYLAASAGFTAYERMLELGVAKECARVVLPEGLTMSRLYMKGSLRSWIHYLDVREGNGTQKEHTDLANMIREELKGVFPNCL
jgi:thymidylate synthase (FAD)